MSANFLHEHPDFKQLIEITAIAQNIQEPSLVEKDYWIMHCLWGLRNVGLRFELKGGTSLSKGLGIIHRFSEDIDIRIEPDEKLLDLKVFAGKNHDKDHQRLSRKTFFDLLATFLEGKISGIVEIERDAAFDDAPRYRNGGVRLRYTPSFDSIEGVKEGILLEVGFDRTAPNLPKSITSWAFEQARTSNVRLIDNRISDVACYDPRYTFVEKLQTVVRKYRQFKETGKLQANFLRHYYDIFHLLALPEVQEFIGTPAYETHKEERFGGDDRKVMNSGAFTLKADADRKEFEAGYTKTRALYYRDQPSLTEILERVSTVLDRL
jgi:hypothetical protein